MNYIERHIGDYLKDTAHLSLLEHGVYARLMDVYYVRETGIPEADAARLIGARTKDEKEALANVLAEFFTLQDGIYRQARCDREIERYRKRADHNREVGKLGGRPRKTETQSFPKQEPENNPLGFQEKPGDNPNRTLSRHQTPDTSNTPPSGGVGRASRLPKPFELPQEWSDWANQERPDLDPAQVAAKFADYWHGKPGKAGTKLDWLATWRNWVRDEKAPRQPFAAPSESFAERDERHARERFEEATGQRHRNVIDITPTQTLERIA